MKTRTEIREEISTINRKIGKLEQQISDLSGKKSELEKELKEVIVFDQTNEILQRIYTYSNDNAIRVRLCNDTRTTPIMDKFESSDKEFLVFEKLFTLSSNFNFASPVVLKGKQEVNYAYNGLTMTDLKKWGGLVSESELRYIGETSRLYPLCRELVDIDKTSPECGKIVPFNIPCLLGGQTFKDQTGFGSEYNGEYLVYQGKNYGETTKFLIIGVIVE